MARKKSGRDTTPDENAPSFEDALAELQRIVADLEDGALGLEESLARFESGMKLLRTCHRVLEQAEQRIAVLTGMDANGNPVTAPFDAAATFDPAEQQRRGADRCAAAEVSPCDEDESRVLF
ncbi:MAG: exodeoxyribonuclease VII small subunit [Planctomycetales bacterium]